MTSSPPSSTIDTSASAAPACFAMFVSDSCTIRKTAVARTLSSSRSGSPMVRRHGTPVRCVKFSASHSTAGTIPRSSSSSGRRSAAIRRVAATVDLSSACIRSRRAANSGSPPSAFALHHATSICSIVSACPSSSCSSRATRFFSCSRAMCDAALSSCSSSFDRRSASSRLHALGHVAQDHGEAASARPARAARSTPRSGIRCHRRAAR